MKIRKWCKGLLDVFTIDQNDVTNTFDQHLQDADSESLSVGSDGKSESSSDPGPIFAFVKFTHRSIPDFLMSVIQDRAAEYSFNDDTIARGIIAMLIAETNSSYNDTGPLTRNLLYCYQHVFRLLRLRDISKSTSIFPMLDELELARFYEYGRTNPDFLSECQNLTSRIDTLRGSQQQFVISWDAQSFHEAFLPWGGSGSVLTHASHSGLHEYIQWKLENKSGFRDNLALLFSALGGLSTYYSFFWTGFPRGYTTTLHLLLKAGAPLDVPVPITSARLGSVFDIRIWDALQFLTQDKPLHTGITLMQDPLPGWTWLVVLPSIIHSLMFSTPHHNAADDLPLWEFLEVWLEFGAMPPMEIVYRELEAQQRSGSNRVKHMEVLYKVSVVSKYRSRLQVIE
jgi:hypothetical protein